MNWAQVNTDNGKFEAKRDKIKRLENASLENVGPQNTDYCLDYTSVKR